MKQAIRWNKWCGVTAVMLLGMLFGSVADAAPAASIKKIREVTYKKHFVNPTRLLLKEPCRRRSNIQAAKRQLKALTNKACRRFVRHKKRYPSFVFASLDPAKSNRFYCQVSLRITSKGYCYRTVYYALGYFQGVAYGKLPVRRRNSRRIRRRATRRRINASQDSYCRQSHIMAKLKQSAFQRAKKQSKSYCLRRGFNLVMKMRMHKYTKLKNLSRKANTYICGARFRFTFQCEHELLY